MPKSSDDTGHRDGPHQRHRQDGQRGFEMPIDSHRLDAEMDSRELMFTDSMMEDVLRRAAASEETSTSLIPAGDVHSPVAPVSFWNREIRIPMKVVAGMVLVVAFVGGGVVTNLSGTLNAGGVLNSQGSTRLTGSSTGPKTANSGGSSAILITTPSGVFSLDQLSKGGGQASVY